MPLGVQHRNESVNRANVALFRSSCAARCLSFFGAALVIWSLTLTIEGQSGGNNSAEAGGRPGSTEVSIDVADLRGEYEARFDKRPANVPLSIKGDGKNYRWVRFPKVDDVVIKGTDQPPGYQAGERLEWNVWYEFRQKLVLNMEISASQEPVHEIKLQLGKLKEGDKPPANQREARDYGKTGVEAGEEIRVALIDSSSSVVLQSTDSPPFEIDTKPIRLGNTAGRSEPSSEATLELRPAQNETGWIFVMFKGSVEITAANDMPKGKITVAPGSTLDRNQYYGFTGILKVVLRKPGFENSDKTILELQGGRGSSDIDSQTAAIAALKDPKQIRASGNPLTIEIQKASSASSRFSVGYVAAVVGVVLLVVVAAFYAWGKWQQHNEHIDEPAATATARHDAYGARPEGPQSMYAPRVLVNPRRGFLARFFPGAAERREAKRRRKDEELEAGKRLQREQLDADRRAIILKPEEGSHQPEVINTSQSTEETFVRYDDLKEEANRVRYELANHGLTNNARVVVDEMLTPLRGDFASLNELVYSLQANFEKEKHVREQSALERASIDNQQTNAKAAFEKKVKEELGDLRNELETARTDYGERLNNIERALRDNRDEQVKSDGFYAALLGLFLERNVAELRPENLTSSIQEAAEGLNKFFEKEIPRSEVLDAVSNQTELIRAALKDVAGRVRLLNGQAEKEIATHVAEVTNLAAKVAAMQAQLRGRQLTLEAQFGFPVTALAGRSSQTEIYDTKMRISVSAHSSARYSFLEELGFAIKREIDKLRDPEGYFKRELERIATSDVIAVADVCHGLVVPAGKNPELEDSLQKLFSSAGLRSILPKQKEKYRPAEQNLIQISTGGTPADSQTIARVLRRGFYYNDNPTPLRRAEVEVYK